MRIYLVKRLFFFVPAIFFIVLLSFILLYYSPGDPVERILNNQSTELTANQAPEKAVEQLREQLGLNLPLFYFSVVSLQEINKENKAIWKEYIPAITLNANNRFHRWLFGDGVYNRGIIRGDLGKSWMTMQPISDMIGPRLLWSLLFTLFSILLAYMVSIPAGIRSALKPESKGVRLMNKIFIVLFSLPAFWVATMLMFLLCNPYVINILPSSGVSPAGGFAGNISLAEKIFITIPYLVLPTICYTYSSFAFLSNNVRASVAAVLREDFIRTARAKGLPERKVIYKHVLRNALLPMITIFSYVFPMTIGGSVILETVFTIPGMGLMIYQSISSQDYPVVIAIFMLTGLVTISSFLISDILYAFADPRISFSKRK